MLLTVEDFLHDRHAATYVPELDAHPQATNRLLALLNVRENEDRLRHASECHRPALDGVVHVLEDDPAIAQVLPGPTGLRFRQAVGVAIRLKMESLGWATTGTKSTVRARYFKKAERYTR
jgi:hypothetical protein